MNNRLTRSTLLLALLAMAALIGLSARAEAGADMDAGVMLASSHGGMQHGQSSGSHMSGDDMPMNQSGTMNDGEMPMTPGTHMDTDDMPMDNGDMDMDDMNMDGVMDNGGQHMMQDGTMMDGQSHDNMMHDDTAPEGMMHDSTN